MSDVEEQFEVEEQQPVVQEELTIVNLATPIPLDVQEAQREVKLFNKWSFQDVEVKDISLVDYIQVGQPVLFHTLLENTPPRDLERLNVQLLKD